MTTQPRFKPKISTEFRMPDGTGGTRSLMIDFESLRGRIFARLRNSMGDDEANRFVLPGINAYNYADYQSALAYFAEAVKHHTEISEELRPHIRICERVLAVVLTPDEISYRDAFERWKRLPRLFKYFRRKPIFKVRCKYCGHYTDYIHPEKGFAYFGENNCQLCGRGYPVPDFAWDGIDGQAYIYYRHSVTEPSFYKEFDEEYDANPDHTFFLRKDKPKRTNQ